ncbi:hypothetical protein AR505_0323 [methanogenic archaeon ISO4-H5]|nr:hypothetical protein AR505_0323 [methanogenic archaeon ISO4-H5]
MTTAKQMTLFAFSYEEKKTGPVWLEDYEGNHRTIPKMDAEATVEYLHKVPAEKGSWWRCLVIEHNRSYNRDLKDWDAEIWLQSGIGIKKKARYSGEVEDCIDPHPYKWHYLDGKQIRPWKYEPLKSVWIEEEILHLTTESGEYMAQIIPNTEIDRYDLHPYQPDTDLEHFTQITECARHIGMELKLPHDVPALENLAMYPVEQTCKTCLHYRSRNKTNGTCISGGNSICCSDYVWDRKTPAKKLKKSKPKEEEAY